MKHQTDDTLLAEELQQIATESGRPLSEVIAQSERDLLELGGNRGKVGAWLFAALSRFIRRRGYAQDPVYDLAELAQVRKALQSGSVVFLVTHKTYLDFFVLYEFFYYLGIPPPRIFGGANMAFAGFGLLARHAGGIFIRRSFRDDPIYKAALRHRLRNLIQQGESFMWAIEGTRSRTGKLLTPKLGLLHYLTNSSQHLAEEQVRFVPVAVVYDQIPDVADMAAQEAGAAKTAESLSWFMRYLRSLGGSFGDIHLRFARPMTLHETPAAPNLKPSADAPGGQAAVQKLAFEACFRINQVSPATPVSLVLLSVLCHGRRKYTEIQQDVQALAAYVHSEHPQAQAQQPSRLIETDTGHQIQTLLSADVLESPAGWPQDEVRIRPQALSMAIYYSNMAVHHFVESAFAELALALLLTRKDHSTQQDFALECLQLRELFKFEFFFSRKGEFHIQLLRELQALGLDPAGPYSREAMLQCLGKKQLRVAVGVLSPYLATYRHVVDYFVDHPARSDEADSALLAAMLSAGNTVPARTNGLPEIGIARALLANGLLVAGNYELRFSAQFSGEFGDEQGETGQTAAVQAKRQAFLARLDAIETALVLLADMNSAETESQPAVV